MYRFEVRSLISVEVSDALKTQVRKMFLKGGNTSFALGDVAEACDADNIVLGGEVAKLIYTHGAGLILKRSEWIE